MTAASPSRNRLQQSGVGDDLQITETIPRKTAGGTWVCGTVAGHRFHALVFREHATRASYELGTSRISKLGIVRLDDDQIVFNWDRGLDGLAASAETQALVDFLAVNLADLAYPDAPEASDCKLRFNEENDK